MYWLVRVYEGKREVLCWACPDAESAEFFGRLLTKGNGRIFAVESPIEGIDCASGWMKVSA